MFTIGHSADLVVVSAMFAKFMNIIFKLERKKKEYLRIIIMEILSKFPVLVLKGAR